MQVKTARSYRNVYGLMNNMMFVNKVREYHSGKSYEELGNDIELAIDYCIDNDIMSVSELYLRECA